MTFLGHVCALALFGPSVVCELIELVPALLLALYTTILVIPITFVDALSIPVRSLTPDAYNYSPCSL